jgi:hypothetical protein
MTLACNEERLNILLVVQCAFLQTRLHSHKFQIVTGNVTQHSWPETRTRDMCRHRDNTPFRNRLQSVWRQNLLASVSTIETCAVSTIEAFHNLRISCRFRHMCIDRPKWTSKAGNARCLAKGHTACASGNERGRNIVTIPRRRPGKTKIQYAGDHGRRNHHSLPLDCSDL